MLTSQRGARWHQPLGDRIGSARLDPESQGVSLTRSTLAPEFSLGPAAAGRPPRAQSKRRAIRLSHASEPGSTRDAPTLYLPATQEWASPLSS